jgi:hypothetical protein
MTSNQVPQCVITGDGEGMRRVFGYLFSKGYILAGDFTKIFLSTATNLSASE